MGEKRYYIFFLKLIAQRSLDQTPIQKIFVLSLSYDEIKDLTRVAISYEINEMSLRSFFRDCFDISVLNL